AVGVEHEGECDRLAGAHRESGRDHPVPIDRERSLAAKRDERGADLPTNPERSELLDSRPSSTEVWSRIRRQRDLDLTTLAPEVANDLVVRHEHPVLVLFRCDGH